jgi:hypothetical protein
MMIVNNLDRWITIVKWYVELSQRDPKNGEMVRKRFKIFDGQNINDLPNVEQRNKFAEKLIANLNERLDAD